MALAAMGTGAVLDVGAAKADAAPSASRFAGNWSGSWSVFDDGQVLFEGTFDWTISDAGRIDGAVHDVTRDVSGRTRGHVAADGKLMVINFAPGGDPSNQNNGVPFQGSAVIDSDDELVVSATCTNSDHALVAILERN
jgi:hypothetical protein